MKCGMRGATNGNACLHTLQFVKLICACRGKKILTMYRQKFQKECETWG